MNTAELVVLVIAAGISIFSVGFLAGRGRLEQELDGMDCERFLKWKSIRSSAVDSFPM